MHCWVLFRLMHCHSVHSLSILESHPPSLFPAMAVSSDNIISCHRWKRWQMLRRSWEKFAWRWIWCSFCCSGLVFCWFSPRAFCPYELFPSGVFPWGWPCPPLLWLLPPTPCHLCKALMHSFGDVYACWCVLVYVCEFQSSILWRAQQA